jgi:hypothetical protein
VRGGAWWQICQGGGFDICVVTDEFIHANSIDSGLTFRWFSVVIPHKK